MCDICSYSLFVLDNENLQDIWDYSTHPNLTIYKGRAFFHSNRKLCNSKIDQLLDHAGLSNSTQEGDIGTNGDQVACTCAKFGSDDTIREQMLNFDFSFNNAVMCMPLVGDVTDLQLSVLDVTESVAILHWNNFRTHDQRSILGWVLYTREAYVAFQLWFLIVFVPYLHGWLLH